MSDESGDKTEEPTPKKIEDSRKKGQVWKSRDLTGVFVFVAGFFAIAATFSLTLQHTKAALEASFAKTALKTIPIEDIAQIAYNGLWDVVLLTLPAAGAAMMAGVLLDFLQVGALFTFEPLTPKLERLDPIQGLKNLFSKKQLIELVKGTFKLIIAAYVAYGVVRDELPLIIQTARADPDLILAAAGQVLYRLSFRIALLFLVFAIFDVWFQHHSYMKDMMMTKEEVKREYKESEGDPYHKAKRKELHQEILEGAMMDEVASADVVVTNPDHYAVALKYDRSKDNAPRVIAKGLDAKAEQIKAIARQAEVATVRNVPLAHALYRVDLGQEIPEGLYDAVAEVLNFVWAQQQKAEA